MGRHTHIWDTGSFCEIWNVADTIQKCKKNRVITFLAFLTSVITVCLLKCLITKYLIFIQIIRVFKFLLMGVPWQTRKYIRGSMMTKRLKSTDVGETHDISFEAPFALRLAGHWHIILPVCLFVISGFCLLFWWMLFLAESLSSLWKYFFSVRLHCSVYITNSLLAANCMCSWVSYLFDCKPLVIKYLIISCGLQSRVAYIFYLFTLSQGLDDAQSFFGYILSTKLFFHIRFSLASCAHPLQKGLW